MIEFFINFFSNIFNLAMVLLFVVIGVFVGLLFRPKARNQVMKVLPRDRRFIDFNIIEENAFGIECEAKKGFPPQRFIKLRAGFSGTVGKFLKKSITRFIGREGTAYTYKTETCKELIGSLADALKGLWGIRFYMNIPEVKRKRLESSKINVTVDIAEETLTPGGLPTVSEEDLKREQDRKAAQTWWEGKKQADKTEWTQWMFIFAAGAGAMAIASKLLGWW